MQLIKELRELEQVIDAKQRKEKLKRIELYQKEYVDVSIYELESQPLLFESDEELEELNHMNDQKQPEDLMTQESSET